MPLTAYGRPFLGVAAALLLAASGCATKSQTGPPTAGMPGPPSLPSPPSAPGAGSTPSTQTSTERGKDGKSGEKAADSDKKEESKKAEAGAPGGSSSGGEDGEADEGKAGETGSTGKGSGESGQDGKKGESAKKAEAGKDGKGQQGTCSAEAGAAGGQPVPAGGQGGLTPGERIATLDSQLEGQMVAFEGVLQKEHERLEEKQKRDPLPERPGGRAGSTSGSGTEDGEGEDGSSRTGDKKAGGKSKDGKAEKGDGEAGEGASATGERTADTGTGGSQAGRADGGTPVTTPVEGGAGSGGGTDDTTVPKDVGDGRDDDVVARQPRGDRRDVGDVLGGQDEHDAVERPRRRRVHREDTRVRVRAAHERRVQRSRKHDVVDVAAAAAQEPRVLEAGNPQADVGRRLDLSHQDPPCAVARTAATMPT